MRDFVVTYETLDGATANEVVKAATVIGAACRFMEMHANLDSGCITAIYRKTA